MKNKFIAMLVGIFLIPIACRTETDYVDKEEARQPFAVFSTTSNNNVAYRKNSKTGSDQIDYASGFAYLLQRHDSIHHKNNTGLVNSTNETTWDDELKQHFIKKSSSAFIEFRIKSQTVVQENQDKWVVFPKIENDKVIDLVGVVLSDSETDVRYYYIDRESEFYKDNVSLFQEKYNKYFTKSNRTTANRDAADRDIDEVTLTHINRRPWWDTGKQSSKGDDASAGGGKCGEYNDCKKDDRGGSGGGGEKPQDRNPCEKIKMNITDTKFSEKVTALNNSTVLNYDHEMGFASSYAPAGTNLGTQYQPMDNRIGTHSVRLPEGNRFFGFIHTHNNQEGVIKIFSPADIMTFLTSCVGNANANGNIRDAYAMVITSQGSYMLQYSGTNSNFTSLSSSLGNWNNQYEDLFRNALENSDGYLSQSTVENLFLQFLKNNVNISGLELYKVDGITSKKLSLNTNNTTNTTPCP